MKRQSKQGKRIIPNSEMKVKFAAIAREVVAMHLWGLDTPIRESDRKELLRLTARFLMEFPEKFIAGSLKAKVPLKQKARIAEARFEALDLWSYLG